MLLISAKGQAEEIFYGGGGYRIISQEDTMQAIE